MTEYRASMWHGRKAKGLREPGSHPLSGHLCCENTPRTVQEHLCMCLFIPSYMHMLCFYFPYSCKMSNVGACITEQAEQNVWDPNAIELVAEVKNSWTHPDSDSQKGFKLSKAEPLPTYSYLNCETSLITTYILQLFQPCFGQEDR